MLQWWGNSGQGILIPWKSFGQGFHMKDPSVRCHINQWTSNGRIIVPRCLDAADYILAICGNDVLKELSSPGKSGSVFYLTQDDRFMIKTIRKSEVKVLIRMLPSYHQHVCQYKNSLVMKFYDVHCVKLVGGQKTHFIVMGNLFCSEYRIHKRFDLKGSYGRTTNKPEGKIDETTTLKDLDLNYVFHLERSWFQELTWQIDRDCEFLERERIMDYNLLIGVHVCDDYLSDEMKMSSFNLDSGRSDTQHDERECQISKVELPDSDWIIVGGYVLFFNIASSLYC